MLKFFLHIVMAVAAMALSGCNNDIFFDEPDIPESQSAMIEGDGGEVSFTIPRKGLDHFGFSLMSSNEKYCTCYNSAGEVVDSDSPHRKSAASSMKPTSPKSNCCATVRSSPSGASARHTSTKPTGPSGSITAMVCAISGLRYFPDARYASTRLHIPNL